MPIVHASSSLEGARNTLIGGEGFHYLSDHTKEIDTDNEQRANQNLAKEQFEFH